MTFHWNNSFRLDTSKQAQEVLFITKVSLISQSFVYLIVIFRGALSGLRQFLAIENLLKIMKNVIYFTSKAFFILKILKFSS